jgi:predicted amidophosphoribosyltransferase
MPAQLVARCVPVPAAGPDVCPLCHGFRRRGYRLCSSCQRVGDQVSRRCSLVVPVSLAATGASPLYRVLRAYKDTGLPGELRAVQVMRVARLVGAFLLAHGGCIARAAGGGWDCIVTVPSSSARRGEHPLLEVARRIAGGPGAVLDALRRGPARIGHLEASDAGYLAGAVAGRRVLLLDDTWTSGARAQSAASALALAGAVVVAVVPAARLVRPAYLDGSPYWQRQRRCRFDPATCCLELPVPPAPAS